MVVSYKEDIICNTFEEYKICISKILSLIEAEIWISENGRQDEYPCLGLLLCKEGAAIYFWDKDENNFASMSDIKGETANETITIHDVFVYEVVRYQIIDRKFAEKVLLDFFVTKNKSDIIKWEEL